MHQALVPLGEDEPKEPMGQIVWLDRGRFVDAPPPRTVPLHRVPPPGWYPDRLRRWDGRDWADEVRPVQQPKSIMRVAYEEIPLAGLVAEERHVEPDIAVPAEVGLLEIPPPVTVANARGRRNRSSAFERGGVKSIIRLLARRRKNRAETVEHLNEGDPSRLDELLGSESPARLPVPAGDTEVPVATHEQTAAAWYPDPNDPGVIRYWDGTQWTDTVAPKPLAVVGDPVARRESSDDTGVAVSHDGPPGVYFDRPDQTHVASHPESPAGSFANEQSSGWRSDPHGLHEGRYFELGQPTNRVRDGSRFSFDELHADAPPPQPATAPAYTQAGHNQPQVDVALVSMPPPPTSARVGSTPDVILTAPEATEVDRWAQKVEQAMTRAQEVKSPEAWSEAAQVAAVLSEMAQAMLVVTKARQTADQAEQAARGAAQAAAAAEQAAKQMAQAVPEAAQAAQVAAKAAAAAGHKARELEEAVARARDADTPEAWREALQLDDGNADDGTKMTTRAPDNAH